jgi:hypothetical protein
MKDCRRCLMAVVGQIVDRRIECPRGIVDCVCVKSRVRISASWSSPLVRQLAPSAWFSIETSSKNKEPPACMPWWNIEPTHTAKCAHVTGGRQTGKDDVSAPARCLNEKVAQEWATCGGKCELSLVSHRGGQFAPAQGGVYLYPS